MCLFDCKCKSLNRQGENINKKTLESFEKNRNTGYPAQDPTANKYLSSSAWEIMYVCCLCFCCFRLVFVCCLVCCYTCLFDCKCKSLKRLGENKQEVKSFEKNMYLQKRKNRNTLYPAHEPPRINIIYLFAVGSWAGYPVFLFVLCFLEVFMFVCVVYVFA